MNIKKISAAFFVGAMIAGCGDNAKDEPAQEKKDTSSKADVAAIVVDGQTLMRSQIDADIEKIVKAQKIPAQQLEYSKQMLANQLAQNFLVEKVLVSKAKADGYTVTDADRKAREDEFLKAAAKMPDAPKSLDEYFKKFPLGEARARSEFESGILIDKMLKAEQAKAPQKDFSAEAKKMIEDIIAKNKACENSQADALKKINELKAQLDKTAEKDLAKKFEELAKENSACPSGQRGGDLGEFPRGQMVKEFDEAVFNLPVNKVSAPVKTQYGYHLIMTTKKIPAVEAKGEAPAKPEMVKASHILVKINAPQDVPKQEDLEKRLKAQETGKFARTFIMGLIRKAKITTSDEFKYLLPPPELPEEAKKGAVEKSEKK